MFLCMVSRAAFGSQGRGSIEEAAGPGALEGGNMQKANFTKPEYKDRLKPKKYQLQTEPGHSSPWVSPEDTLSRTASRSQRQGFCFVGGIYFDGNLINSRFLSEHSPKFVHAQQPTLLPNHDLLSQGWRYHVTKMSGLVRNRLRRIGGKPAGY